MAAAAMLLPVDFESVLIFNPQCEMFLLLSRDVSAHGKNLVEARPEANDERNVFQLLPRGKEFLIYNPILNGYLRVSPDKEKADFLVDATPEVSDRAKFELLPAGRGRFRIYNPETQTYLFISATGGIEGKHVRAHPVATDHRNIFELFPRLTATNG